MNIKQRPLPQDKLHLASYPELLQRIYAARGIFATAQLETSLASLLPFHLLRDIDKACVRLVSALRQNQRILIIGDFDADGATSTAVAMLALKSMGAGYVNFLVPNRFDFGYGLTPAIVAVAKKWQPDLIVTVDNGIASLEGVNAANAAGIDVVITDHHLQGEVLPAACAIVNPNQAHDPFPSKAMAGVGVIFYVMLALRSYLCKINWFQEKNIAKPNMAQFLDLVALGTVADVVPLDQNNRIMVHQGLLRIQQGYCRPGIKALIQIAKRDYTKLRASDLGFAIAPRLNAAGRLDDMTLGIECLLSANEEQALMLAGKLDKLNQERRVIEAEMKEQATDAIENLGDKLLQFSSLPPALCLMDKSWHQGVIGILAGRLKDRYHRPVIAFAAVSKDELKGSARSVVNLNIRDVLAAIDKDHPGIIIKFGGHAMAAGLSIYSDKFFIFQQALNDEVSKHLTPEDYEGEILTDGGLGYHELNSANANLIQQAGPWGQQFPEPCFDDIFKVLDQRLINERHLKLTLQHHEGGSCIDAIAFNINRDSFSHRTTKIHAVYKLENNVYLGRTKLQLIIEHFIIFS